MLGLDRDRVMQTGANRHRVPWRMAGRAEDAHLGVADHNVVADQNGLSDRRLPRYPMVERSIEGGQTQSSAGKGEEEQDGLPAIHPVSGHQGWRIHEGTEGVHENDLSTRSGRQVPWQRTRNLLVPWEPAERPSAAGLAPWAPICIFNVYTPQSSVGENSN